MPCAHGQYHSIVSVPVPTHPNTDHTQILRAYNPCWGWLGLGPRLVTVVYGGELSNRDGGAHAMIHVLSVTER